MQRRWFQFSLRTFFIAIVFAALATVWTLRERAAIVNRDDLAEWTHEQNALVMRDNSFIIEQLWDIRPSKEPPVFWKRLLGQKVLVEVIIYPHGATDSELDRIKTAFPEAELVTWPE